MGQCPYFDGDFNSRLHMLHTRKANEYEILGPHIFGRGAEYLEVLENNGSGSAINRQLFTEFLLENMYCCNTNFQKLDKFKVTYKEVNKENKEPPFDAESFAEIDFIIVQQR